MSYVEVEREENGIAWLRLNRPDKLNPLGDELRRELFAALQTLDADDTVRCLVLTGNGRAFSAGGDVKGMAGRGPWLTTERMFATSHIINALMDIRKPTIAALNGLAVGAGASMALCCDLILASESAWLSFLFIERGLVPDFASSYFLPRAVGSARAKALAMTARRITATEAQEMGIVAEVYADDGFEAQVRAQATALAAGNIHVMPLIRRMINHSFESDFRSSLEREALAQGVAVTHGSHHDSVAGFVGNHSSDEATQR